MCGIFGIFGKNDKESIRKMSKLLKHRGPDNTSFFSGKNVELGNNRLKIIDLSKNGNQPMSNEDKSIWITYNGETYNFEELKGELETKDHKFKSKTDTEVILHAYEEYGVDFVRRLDGMFAIGIYDSNKEKLVLVRDRVGIKPLYYTLKDDVFLFASEMKALLDKKPKLNDNQFNPNSFFDNSEKTPFQDIKELLPGHMLEASMTKDGLKTKIKKYWAVSEGILHKDEKTVINELSSLIEKSVKQKLVSDIPIGLFLSGGLDSSLIGALAKEDYGEKIIGFCVGTERSNEFEKAREVADYLGITLIAKQLTIKEIIEAIPKVIYYLEDYDPRNVEVGIMNYYLSALAREQGIKVILMGEGADEIYGGYGREYDKGAYSYKELLMRLKSNHLKSKDRASMANAVELRVPFLDNTCLLEYEMTIDPALKVKNGIKKYILRKVASRYLPEEIANREKGHGHILSGIPFIINDYFNIQKGGSLKARFNIYLGIFKRIFENGESYNKISLKRK